MIKTREKRARLWGGGWGGGGERRATAVDYREVYFVLYQVNISVLMFKIIITFRKSIYR